MASSTGRCIRVMVLLLATVILQSNGQSSEAEDDKLFSDVFYTTPDNVTAADIPRVGDPENVSFNRRNHEFCC